MIFLSLTTTYLVLWVLLVLGAYWAACIAFSIFSFSTCLCSKDLIDLLALNSCSKIFFSGINSFFIKWKSSSSKESWDIAFVGQIETQ